MYIMWKTNAYCLCKYAWKIPIAVLKIFSKCIVLMPVPVAAQSKA